MVEVIKLDGGDSSNSTAQIDERLGGECLTGEPLSSYLGGNEQVAFVIHSKRRGVQIERDGDSETYKPTRGLRTVVAITDLRLVIAIGGADADGDRIIPIPFSSMTRIDTESGLLREQLIVRTSAGEQWSLPAGGDLKAITSHLEACKAAWSQVNRLGARIDERLMAARDRLEEGDPDAAREAAKEGLSMVAAGRDQLQTDDIGERVLAHAEFDTYRESIRALQRRALAMLAGDHIEQANDHEAAGRLRAAHESLQNARDATAQARSIDAERPSERLEDRQQSIERDLARIEGKPRETAITALKTAKSIDNPRQRAQQLAEALSAHRDWLGLCWGPAAPFEGDSEAIRARILEIVDRLIRAHTSVIERLLAAAQRLHTNGRSKQALSACDQAEGRLATANEIVAELDPDRTQTMTEWQITIDHQRALIERDDSPVDFGPQSATGWGDHTDVETTTTRADNGSGNGETIVAGVTTDERDTDSAEPSDVGGNRNVDLALADDAQGGSPDRRASLDMAIRSMDESAFTEFIAACWRELGWETTFFTKSSAKYDIMAIRRQAIDLRMLIWTVHTPSRDLDAATVDRCVTDRDETERVDAAALVTTADIPESVRQRAVDHGIKLLDRDDLLDLIENEQLTDLALATK